MEKSNLIHEHALNREPVPLTKTHSKGDAYWKEGAKSNH